MVLGTYAAVSNLFTLGRHLARDKYYSDLRGCAFSEWSRAVARYFANGSLWNQLVNLSKPPGALIQGDD